AAQTPAGRGATGARRARRAHALRRRRGHLHRRSLVHPALRLPVADDQGQQRSAEGRSGRACEQRLRRLWTVRRGRARRCAVPELLSRRDRPESECIRSIADEAADDGDRMDAAELVEAGRAMQNGYVTSRTTLIAATHRIYATSEKMPPGDGRFDASRIVAAGPQLARRAAFIDMAALAEANRTVISAVM